MLGSGFRVMNKRKGAALVEFILVAYILCGELYYL
jgi:Flp pilus assembly protein TadG